MKFFRPPNFFKHFEQFQKLVAFLLPIFGNVDEFVACHEYTTRFHACPSCTKTVEGVPKIFSMFGTRPQEDGVVFIHTCNLSLPLPTSV